MPNTFVFANNVKTSLSVAASSTSTTLTLSSSANFPTIPAGAYWPLTLNDKATGQYYEIVWVSSYSGSVVTCLRGQEGTSALNWLVGDNVFSTNTAQTTAPAEGNPSVDFQTNALTASGLITANGGVDVAGGTLTVPNAAVSENPVNLGQLIKNFGNSAVGTSNSLSVSATFTPPQNGLVFLAFNGSFASGAITGNNPASSGGTIQNGSGTSGGNASVEIGTFQYAVTAGTPFTFTMSMTNSVSASWGASISSIFIPTP